jgi:hypothetical protein
MQPIRLESRTLASALYDPDRLHLELKFRSGKRYLYFHVPPLCYQELLQAESKGSYFNRSIRNRFAFQDLSKPSAPSSCPRPKN